MKKRIAIIGAGISGLTLARELSQAFEVVVFEKARGVGGRMSTRYADPFSFDHGTQYFTARSKEFKKFLKPYIEDGTVDSWEGKIIGLELGKKATKDMWFEPHYVASPNMNSLCKKLAEGVDIRLNTKVTTILREKGDIWALFDEAENALDHFDWIISTAPPEQTRTLFKSFLTTDSALINSRMRGCYALMLGFKKSWDKQWIAAKVNSSELKWIGINSSKPNRNKDVTSIVVHSRNDWAEEHIEDDLVTIEKILLAKLELVTGISCENAEYVSTHRWRYAISENKVSSNFYLDKEQQLAATGDWSTASRIEDVWLATKKLAKALQS
jgi:renalase